MPRPCRSIRGRSQSVSHCFCGQALDGARPSLCCYCRCSSRRRPPKPRRGPSARRTRPCRRATIARPSGFTRKYIHTWVLWARAQALYNAGNALARLERYADASARYQAALRLVPNFSKAALNLSLVNEFLDARRGLRQREDNESLPAGSKTRSDARDSAAVGRGDDATLPSSAPPDAQRNTRQQDQSARAGERSDHPAAQTKDDAQTTADLQQTLTLWRNAGARGGGIAPE